MCSEWLWAFEPTRVSFTLSRLIARSTVRTRTMYSVASECFKSEKRESKTESMKFGGRLMASHWLHMKRTAFSLRPPGAISTYSRSQPSRADVDFSRHIFSLRGSPTIGPLKWSLTRLSEGKRGDWETARVGDLVSLSSVACQVPSEPKSLNHTFWCRDCYFEFLKIASFANCIANFWRKVTGYIWTSACSRAGTSLNKKGVLYSLLCTIWISLVIPFQ